MLRRSTLMCSFALVALTLAVANPVFAAGEMSADEKSAWDTVNAYWEKWGGGDVEGFLGFVHDDYVGWSNDAPLPSGKASSRKWMSFWASSNQILVWEIAPASVTVHGDVAVAHYYYSYVSKDSEGKTKQLEGRWTDILLKSQGKWKLIADHGGSDDDD